MSEKIDQTSLVFVDENESDPVICLGLTFKNEDERREYFREELRKKLPNLKKNEGFPIGEDEDIIALSDPPYYTACPNPWLNDFIEMWTKEKNDDLSYNREPFATDVSEGKNDAVYNAHNYHTKVPYKAIMRFILHYTKPGDIVFDGFSGSGMTGIAAQMCGSEKVIKDLGYTIKGSEIFDQGTNLISEIGGRYSILNDLSPAATFTSYNYNTYINLEKYKHQAQKILDDIEQECSWMFETNHTLDGTVQKNSKSEIIKGIINYIVYSDVFLCSNCAEEFVFWDEAVDEQKGKVRDVFDCPKCKAELTKKSIERSMETKFDTRIGSSITQAKQYPVMINYKVGNKRFEKKPDDFDLENLRKINSIEIPYWYPGDELPKGYNTEQPKKSHGFTHVHHFYVKQNMYVFSKLASASVKNPFLYSLIGDMLPRASKMHKIAVSRLNTNLSKTAGILSGTLYIPSNSIAYSALEMLKYRVKDIINYIENVKHVKGSNVITNQSSTEVKQIKDNSIDYIFTDPPFGANLMYSELNYLWESWLKVFTNNNKESIINNVQNKSINDYQSLMIECFKEYYRILKDGRWLTVEFSNSQSTIWNAIREAIEKAGFVIANVSALDKKQGSFKAVTTTTAVKQDLVISAYKPNENDIEIIKNNQDTERSAWKFIEQHLQKLPVFIGAKGNAELIVERTPRILFDRMVAYHVQNGLAVPLSSSDFQLQINQKYPSRDGMIFLDTQVSDYDRKRIISKEFSQITLFVSDENSSIEWIRQQLLNKPQTRQDIHPRFMKEIQHIAKHELLPELDSLLEQNFLMYDGIEEVPSQIHGYLSSNYKDLRGLQKTDSKLKEKAKNRWYVPDPNKQADLEKLREKSLLREFEGYKSEIEGNKKKLKQFRTEAVRTGFKKAWSEKDYETIIKIGERLPEKVLQEDDKLLMYFDNAQIRLGV
ncbi:DNA methyltransferase [Metabacillus idriensis]|uniref:DNA methyltransferase n=1 Tax=Metabacillus idriensis TaxID=324768 RepID=UPI00174B5FDC|nr:DNA methyltransferase [Metabacillus idriensis]